MARYYSELRTEALGKKESSNLLHTEEDPSLYVAPVLHRWRHVRYTLLHIVVLGGRQELLGLSEFVHGGLDELRLGPDVAPVADLPLGEVSDSQFKPNLPRPHDANLFSIKMDGQVTALILPLLSIVKVHST